MRAHVLLGLFLLVAEEAPVMGMGAVPCRRHAALPMVCRRWNELCYSPELLRQLVVHVRGSLEPDDYDYGEGSVCRRLQTFFSWLLGRRGAVRHVQRLEVRGLVAWGWDPKAHMG